MQPSIRILFIDDEKTVRIMFRQSLRKMGYAVDLAADSEQACDLASRYNYAVIATDYRMPEVDGLGVIRRLRTLQPDAVYLMITGCTKLALPKNCEDANSISEIVYKPFGQEQLQQSIERSMEVYAKRLARRHVALAIDDKQGQVNRILVIEDNPADFDLVKSMLRRSEIERFEVVHAERIMDGLNYLHTENFDAVLVDLSLPDARGLTAVAMIHGAAKNTPVLVMTGQDDEDLERQAVAIGAQDFLMKGKIEPRALNRAIAFAIQRQRSQERLAYLANYNHLTGLPNRSLFRERLTETVARSSRQQKIVGLFFIDLDRFKAINDTYGHDAGDALLVEIAHRLRSCSRGTDTVAHLSGDEFTIIVDGLDGPEGATILAQRVLDSLTKPVCIGEHELRVTCSIGIAMYSQGMEMEQLIKNADSAMYQAKNMGRNQYSFSPVESPAGSSHPQNEVDNKEAMPTL